MITVNNDVWMVRMGFIIEHCTGEKMKRDRGGIVWCKDCPKWKNGHCIHPLHPANREGGQKFRTYLEVK
jgi:ribosomal protein L37AE/L43A